MFLILRKKERFRPPFSSVRPLIALELGTYSTATEPSVDPKDRPQEGV